MKSTLATKILHVIHQTHVNLEPAWFALCHDAFNVSVRQRKEMQLLLALQCLWALYPWILDQKYLEEDCIHTEYV